jgi:hypothetical protein
MYFLSKFRSSGNRQRRLRSAVPQVELLEDRLQPSSLLLGEELVSNLAPDPAFTATAQEKAPIQFLLSTGEEYSKLSPVAAASVSAAGGQTADHGAVAQPAMPAQPSQPYGHNSAPPVANASLAPGAPAKGLASSLVSTSPTTVSPSLRVHTLTELQVTVHLVTPQIQLSPTASHSVPQQQINTYASQNWATYVTQTPSVATGQAVAVDSNGNVYVTGATDESTVKKAFVAEYDPSGNRIFYTTFQAMDVLSYPGRVVNYSHSQGNAIALDGNGKIYVVGTATELNSPHYQDAFIMRFDRSGNVDPTYGAGFNSPAGNVSGNGVVVSPDGTATIVGSGRLPASDGSGAIHQDIFLAQLAHDGSVPLLDDGIQPYYFGFDPKGLSYQGQQVFSATFGSAIALSPDGSTAYVSGTGSAIGGSSDSIVMAFPVSMPITFDIGRGQWVQNGPMVVVGSNDGPVSGRGLAVGADGIVYQAGTTSYQVNGLTSTYPFAIIWTADLSTVLNQGLDDSQPGGTGTGISVDPAGNIYLTGTGFDQNGIQRALIDYLQPAGGNQLQVSDNTLIAENGGGQEAGWGIAYSTASNTVFVVGDTTSSNLDTTGQTSLNGTQDAFLANVGSFMN